MPALDLPALARRQGIRRAAVALRPIEPTQAHAQELVALYLPIVRAWRENLEPIMAGYTVPTLDGLTIDAPADHQAAIDRTEDEVSRLSLAFGSGVREWAVKVERWHRSRWAAAVKAGTRVELATILTAQPVQETLEAVIARNVALVKDISDQARGRISDAVFRAYQNRTPARELAKELREAAGMARTRAIRVASHQNNALSAALDTERMAEAGIAWFKWRHSAKRFPREEHKARDGKIYDLKTGKRRGGGETIPNGDRPGMKPNCGCKAAAWLPIMEELE